MNIASITSSVRHESGLLGQTVVVIGGSAGIGLETARRARAEGAKVSLPVIQNVLKVLQVSLMH